MSGPYAYAAADYWNAGWRGVLPLPAGQKAPQTIAEKAEFTGYTGYAGRDPSYPDVMAWIEDRGTGNVALHLPPGVLGLDIDDYTAPDGKIKRGGDTLERCEANWGTLPPTWRTTSRDNVSGIRLFRVPVTGTDRHLRWPGSFGPGTETIHAGHRYIVVPPSIHPATGAPYRWIAPDGSVSTDPPRLADLPELPWAWVVGLTEGREAHTYQGAGMNDTDVRAWLEAHNHGQHMCPPMREVSDHVLEEMSDGAHESLSYLMRLVSLAGRGHEGLYPALNRVRAQFLDIAGRRRDGGRDEAEEEWRRSLFGAVDKIVGSGELPAETGGDPCDRGVVAVDPSPAVDAAVDPPREDPSDGAPKSGDLDAEPTFRHTDQPAPEPRELTNEEQAELAAARRENDIAKKAAELELIAEARARIAAKNAPPLTLLGIDDFLARPRPVPLVEGLLYRNSLSRIFGAPGCGKSFVAIDLALRMALGWSWGGSEVKQAKVVYVMAEGDAVNNERTQAWMDRHHVKAEQLRGWFQAVPHKVLLLEDAVQPFIQAIKDQQIDLVVLDTKNRMMIGNENHSEDNATMIRAVDAIREATGCCVLLIDHTGLNATGRAKGDNSTEGSMETEAEVRNDHQHPPKVTVEVTRNKARVIGTTWEFFLRHHPIEIDGEVVPTAVLLPIGDDVVLPEARMSSKQAETAWLQYDGPIPTEVLGYDGGEAVTRAMPDLARLMAHDAGIADPNRIGVSLSDAVRALSETALGKGRGHSRGTVRRAWSAIRDLGYIVPVEAERGDDPEKVAKAMEEKTTGKHVWARR